MFCPWNGKLLQKNSVLSEQWRIQQEGLPSLYLQEYVVILCIVRQNSNSVKSSFPRKNVEVEQGPVISRFLGCLDNFCLFEFFWLFNEDVVYFFLASLCMSGLLSNRWRLLSSEDQNTLTFSVVLNEQKTGLHLWKANLNRLLILISKFQFSDEILTWHLFFK